MAMPNNYDYEIGISTIDAAALTAGVITTNTASIHQASSNTPPFSSANYNVAIQHYTSNLGVDWASYGQHMYLTQAKGWEFVTASIDGERVLLYRHKTKSGDALGLADAVALQGGLDAVAL